MDFDLVYHCDARPAIGMGHLKRGLDVLGALRERRPEDRLGICGSFTAQAEEFLEAHLPQSVTVLRVDETARTRVAVLDTMADPARPAALDRDRAGRIRPTTETLVLVSSAIEVELSADIDVLIDHMPNVSLLGPAPRRQLLGLAYAPVSREFMPAADEGEPTGANLVGVIGGNDLQDGPALLLRCLESADLEGFDGIEVIVSPHFPDAAVGELAARHPGVRILRNVPSIRPHLRAARAVICTYGNITYESLTLHRPTLVVAYKAFQEAYARELERMGLVVNLGRFEGLRRESFRVLASDAALAALAEAAAGTFTAPGIERIATALEEEMDSVPQA